MAIREKELGGIRENIIENNGGICAYHRSIRKKWIIIAGMAVAVLFFMIISVNAGSTAMSPLDVLETVLELDPEVIILDAGGMSLVKEDYNNNPNFYKSLSAVRNGKTYIQMPFNNYITNIDIALADAYYTGKVLYPDAFSDIDPAEKFDEITQYLLGINAYEKIASQYHGGFQQANFDK